MKIEIEDLKMVQGIALVKLVKSRTYKETQTVLDVEKNKGKDPKKDIMALKEEVTKVMYNIQTVEILSVDPNNGQKLKPGDICIMDWRKVKDFDLYKNVKSINLYDILGIINS